MGFPLGRYGMLAQIVNGIRKKEYWAMKKYDSIKMVVLVLHDPDDYELANLLQNRFCNLDYQTGQHMLFLTWVDPPKRWLNSNFNDYNDIFSQVSISFDKSGNNLNRNLELIEMRSRFGISANQSSLVVFTHLLSRNYLVINTSYTDIEQQLRTIGDFCFDFQERNFENEQEAFDMLARRVNGVRKEKEEEAADMLLDVLSLCSREILFPEDRTIRSLRAQRVLELAKTKVQKRLINNEDASDEMFNLLNIIAMRYDMTANKFCRSSDYICDFEPMHKFRCHKDTMGIISYIPAGLEKSTEVYCNTYNSLIRVFQRQGTDCVDTSALIVYLAKILECECNASIFQYCRMLNKVPMPDYYKSFCPHIPAGSEIRFMIDGNDLFCHINRYKKNLDDEKILENCTLGGINVLVQWLRLLNDKLVADFPHYETWKKMVDLRNNAAHGGYMVNYQNELSVAYELFENIFRSSFKSLLFMKEACIGYRRNCFRYNNKYHMELFPDNSPINC